MDVSMLFEVRACRYIKSTQPIELLARLVESYATTFDFRIQSQSVTLLCLLGHLAEGLPTLGLLVPHLFHLIRVPTNVSDHLALQLANSASYVTPVLFRII